MSVITTRTRWREPNFWLQMPRKRQGHDGVFFQQWTDDQNGGRGFSTRSRAPVTKFTVLNVFLVLICCVLLIYSRYYGVQLAASTPERGLRYFLISRRLGCRCFCLPRSWQLLFFNSSVHKCCGRQVCKLINRPAQLLFTGALCI